MPTDYYYEEMPMTDDYYNDYEDGGDYKDYIDFDWAYSFAPENWGDSKKWMDNMFCGGMTEDPMGMAVATMFPDEYWMGFESRNECF
jgi:hypothetical protein